ncbi:MAG: Hsp70 family protein, partial [Acidobacteriota bacterium]|nr:Hsp70 family protein [Acidobacteriota bacterium]
QLWANCRAAKEHLLEPGSTVAGHPVTILGKGSGLVGGTIKATLERADIERVLTEGFLPEVASGDMPAGQRRVGVQELGLPYAADAAITRHLARFLRQQAAGAEHGTVRRGPSGLAAPTHVLFNGGVLQAPLVRNRILATLDAWLAAEGLPPVKPLEGEDLMHAVSRGAAYYGLARDGRGVRIRGGVPRTYYIGVESAMPSIPGFPAPLKALTVVPFGIEEGTEVRIPGREFGLVVGQPAEFRFFTSAERKNDRPGDLIEDFGGELAELSPMEVAFEAGETSEVVPVSFEGVVTETGVLQLWAAARDGRRWKLEFNVREKVA